MLAIRAFVKLFKEKKDRQLDKNNNMRILYITKHDPFGLGGGATASRNFMEAFITIFPDYEFDILICDELLHKISQKYRDISSLHFIGVPKRSFFSRMASPLTGVMHRFQKTALRYLSIREYDYCIFDHSSIAGSLVYAALNKGIKTIVIHHNFERDFFKDNNIFIVGWLLLYQVAKNEKAAYMNSNYNIFLTQEDCDKFKNCYGESKGRSIVRYIFESSSNKVLQSTKLSIPPKNIVITGSLNNMQNIDGINYFIDNIYQLIPDKYHIIISGQGPSSSLLEKLRRYSNIEVIPNPADMGDVIKRGDIYVCLTRLGSGIKVRITDGLRMGLPVIAHVVSSRGYGAFVKRGYMETFDTPELFVKALTRIEEKICQNANLSDEISSYYHSTCSFDNSLNVLCNSLK